MRIQYSKKVQTSNFEPVMFLAELTSDDFGIKLDGDPELAHLAMTFLMDRAQKGVLASMNQAGILHDGEFDEASARLMTDDQAKETLAVLKLEPQS